jgi:hypothetical protein
MEASVGEWELACRLDVMLRVSEDWCCRFVNQASESLCVIYGGVQMYLNASLAPPTANLTLWKNCCRCR